MLTLTPDAAQTIERLLEGPEVPDAGGLRIAAAESMNGDGEARALQVALAAEPAPKDVVVEEAGARVFIEPTVVPFLDDKLLDVAVDGERTQFSLQPAP
jgi:Fe-S cluster assembly iron-binding protein IscA